MQDSKVKTQKQIRRIVTKLLEQNKIETLPVPVGDLARKMGVEIRYSPFDGDISGMVFRHEERVVIGVNSLHHPNRQRFTIAHEIGHFLLHKGKEVHVDRTFRVNLRNDVSSQATDPTEIEANRFAAELLMPYDMIIDDLVKHGIDVENEEDFKELSKKYGVSVQAITFRITNIFNEII